MKNLGEITKEELDSLKVVTFDIDGVIVPVGTEIKENVVGTELYMKSQRPTLEFMETLRKLKKYIGLNFSSGRNILYLKSLVNSIFDSRVSLQAENGNITLVNNKIIHPEYTNDYFNKLRDIKEKIKEMIVASDKRIRGFEPKLFILTVHCEEMEEISKIVKDIAGDDFYCLWTNEGYDIGSKKTTKGVAIKNLAETLEIEPKQIMTTGNNFNDAEMLQVGKGVTVNPERVEGEYMVERTPEKLGGEIVAEFLLKYFESK